MGVGAGETLARAGLAGVWELVSCTIIHADGRVEEPYGSAPRGLIAYTADGWMSCQMDGAPTGYTAYYGPCTLDEEQATVIHHVRGSSSSFTRGDQRRAYVVSGDKLTLSAELPDAVIAVLWRRPD